LSRYFVVYKILEDVIQYHLGIWRFGFFYANIFQQGIWIIQYIDGDVELVDLRCSINVIFLCGDDPTVIEDLVGLMTRL
jgi:hypothetical protein